MGCLIYFKTGVIDNIDFISVFRFTFFFFFKVCLFVISILHSHLFQKRLVIYSFYNSVCYNTEMGKSSKQFKKLVFIIVFQGTKLRKFTEFTCS